MPASFSSETPFGSICIKAYKTTKNICFTKKSLYIRGRCTSRPLSGRVPLYNRAVVHNRQLFVIGRSTVPQKRPTLKKYHFLWKKLILVTTVVNLFGLKTSICYCPVCGGFNDLIYVSIPFVVFDKKRRLEV